MTSKRQLGCVFREGDEVVLAEGTYQGTLGVFFRLRNDIRWADITERDGSVRSHPVAWLGRSTDVTRGGAAQVELKAARPPEMESNMNSSFDTDIGAWEGEGGAAPAPLGFRVISMNRATSPCST